MAALRIAVFTGNRSEYGLLFPVINTIHKSTNVELSLLVSGSHLDADFGHTLEEIEHDGFQIASHIHFVKSRGSLKETPAAIGQGIIAVHEALLAHKPDILLVYGDRFEAFAAVIAASQMGLPVAHMEGGDITEGGTLDDSVRHAMTKLSHLHFTTNERARNRVLAMGEEAWRVTNTGFLSMGDAAMLNVASDELLLKNYDLDPALPLIIFTEHAIALETAANVPRLKQSLQALENIAPEAQIIITYPNNDAGGRLMIDQLEIWFRDKQGKNIQLHKSLGHANYHGLLAMARFPGRRIVCVGNSSSGLKETPLFQCPAVNIGDRQKGRLQGNNVINTAHNTKDIEDAIRTALWNEEFRERASLAINPYQTGDVGAIIVKTLLSQTDNKDILRKKMTLKGEFRSGWFR